MDTLEVMLTKQLWSRIEKDSPYKSQDIKERALVSGFRWRPSRGKGFA